MKSIIKLLVHTKVSSMGILALGGIMLFGLSAAAISTHNTSDTILNSSTNVPTTAAASSNSNSGSSTSSVSLPSCGAQYTNHGKYVSTVAKMHPGGAVVSQAAKSSCGKPAGNKSSSENSKSNSGSTTTSDQSTTSTDANSSSNNSGIDSHANAHANHP